MKDLLDSVDLEGIGYRENEYCARFPIFALSENPADFAELVGVNHPATGLPTAFVFTDRHEAVQFATQFGQGTVVKIADDEAALRNVLRRSKAHAIALDPVIYKGILQVKFQALVSTIIENHASPGKNRLSTDR